MGGLHFIGRSLTIMNNLNSILIEGNLVRDPVFRTTPKGTGVCKFPLASNRFYKQENGLEKEVSFFDVESWGKLAENVNNKGRKGRGVRVVGRLKQERWQNNEGKDMAKVVIVAEHVEFRPDTTKQPSEEEPQVAEESENVETAETVENLVPTF